VKKTTEKATEKDMETRTFVPPEKLRKFLRILFYRGSREKPENEKAKWIKKIQTRERFGLRW
jgi:hypothetical protein